MDKYISNKIKNISLIMTFFVVILHSNNLENASVFNVNTLVQNFKYISYNDFLRCYTSFKQLRKCISI